MHSVVQIEHSANKVNVIIETARPGLIIGRGGGGVDALKKEVENKIQKKLKMRTLGAPHREIKIEIREIKNPWISSALVAQMAAQQIEKRMPFRQVLKKSIERAMTNKEVKGIRLEVSGRLKRSRSRTAQRPHSKYFILKDSCSRYLAIRRAPN